MATTSGSTLPTASAASMASMTTAAGRRRCQQHPDQGPGAGPITQLAASLDPEPLMGLGEGARRPGLGLGGGAGQGPRLPHANRYQLTPPGRRVAVLFTKTYGRVLAPGLVQLDPSLPAELAARSPLPLPGVASTTPSTTTSAARPRPREADLFVNSVPSKSD